MSFVNQQRLLRPQRHYHRRDETHTSGGWHCGARVANVRAVRPIWILGLAGAAALLDCFGKDRFVARVAVLVAEARFADDFRWSCRRCDCEPVSAQKMKSTPHVRPG